MPFISLPPPNTSWEIARIAEISAVTATCKTDTNEGGAAHDPYAIPEVDIPIITWKYEDTDCQGLWMRAERLNGKFDYMHGFSTTVIGGHGMIEVLGEGGHNLLWNGVQQHLLLHREGEETRAFRFDEGRRRRLAIRHQLLQPRAYQPSPSPYRLYPQ